MGLHRGSHPLELLQNLAYLEFLRDFGEIYRWIPEGAGLLEITFIYFPATSNKTLVRVSSLGMKLVSTSIGLALSSVLGVASAEQPKIEVASPVEGVFVTYGWHSMVIELKDGKFRYWFSSDAKGSDVEALEGTYTAEGDKLELKHPSLIPLVSDWKVRSIDGVVTLWRSDALKQLANGGLDPYRAGKENFFRTGGGSILVPSAKTAEEAWKSPQVAVLTEAQSKALLEGEKAEKGDVVKPVKPGE